MDRRHELVAQAVAAAGCLGPLEEAMSVSGVSVTHLFVVIASLLASDACTGMHAQKDIACGTKGVGRWANALYGYMRMYLCLLQRAG